jgi:hypothetical protein
MVNDDYKVQKAKNGKPVELAMTESSDPSLDRLLKTLDGHVAQVRILPSDDGTSAQVLSVFVDSKDWHAPISAADGSRIEDVSNAYNSGGEGLEVTGIDAQGRAIVWTPVGSGTMPADGLSVTVDPVEHGLFGSAFPKVGHLPLTGLLQTEHTGIVQALDGATAPAPAAKPAPQQAPAVTPPAPAPPAEKKPSLPAPGGD